MSHQKSGSARTGGEYTITDLIPLEKLQEFQDRFAAANQVASTLTDPDGIPITRPSNHSPVCRMIRETREGYSRCVRSGRILGKRAREKRCTIHQKCFSIGFTDGAAPIIVDGKHIANWLIGQNHVGEVDEQRVREYALEIGADPEQMAAAFDSMPKMSLGEFETRLALLQLMADELSNMGYLNLVLKRQTAELTAATKELERHQQILEERVAARTADLAQANQQLELEIKRKNKIQRRQAILVTAIRSAAESIVITTPTGRIIYTNPAFEKMTGYSRRELIGKNPRILKSGIHDNTFYRELWQTITSGATWSGTISNRRRDGTIYQERCTISPVTDDEENIVNFVAVKKDISRQLELEKQLLQAQRLEAIGTLAAGIAHEINSPIQFLLSNTDFFRELLSDLSRLIEGYEKLAGAAESIPDLAEPLAAVRQLSEELEPDYLVEEGTSALEQNEAGINRIADIIRALKAFADPGPATREPADLGELIETTVTVSRNLWKTVGNLTTSIGENLPKIELYETKFKQLLLDMILNSVQSIEERLKTDPERPGEIRISLGREREWLELVIEDNGTGIEPEVVDKIFDPFFTTREVGSGRGQGLSTVFTVITEEHGGTITVDGNPGKGARFVIRLPLADGNGHH